MFFIIGTMCYSQPISQRSSDVITVMDGNIFAKNSFRPAVYYDTTAANLVVSLDSCGKMIFTYSTNSYWLRACSPKRWVRILKESDITLNLQEVTDNGNKTTDTIIAGFFKLDSLNTSRTTKDAFIVKDYLSGQLKSRRQIIDTSVARQTLLTWNLQTTPLNSIWANLTWSQELKMIVATSHSSGNATGVMTSLDGIAWTLRNTPQENWRGVAWSPKLKLFAAIASTGTNNGVMTSPDGITWTRGTLPNSYFYRYIIWVEELGLFVACALTASVTDKILTSPDGINWTARTCPDRNWNILTYAPDKNLLVCAAAHNGTVAGVMTSPDGITWSLSADTIANNGNWEGLCYSQDLGLFVMASHNFNPAVGVAGKQVAVSPDGINWTRATTPADGLWLSVAWSPEAGMFVAVGEDITNSAQVMVSTDAYTWSLVTPAAAKTWRRVIWAKELGSFIGLAYYNGSTPANNLVMTSSPADINQHYVSIYRRGETQNIQGRLNFKSATQTDSTATFGDSITQNVTTKHNLLRSTTFIGDRNIEGTPYNFFMTGSLRVYSEESLSANPTLNTSLGLGRYLYLNNGASMTADYNAVLSNAVPRLRGAVTMQGFGGFPIAAHQFNYLFTRSPDFGGTPSVSSGSTPAQANANMSLRTGIQNAGAITATGWFAGLELQLRMRNDAHTMESYADIISGNFDRSSSATVTNRHGLYIQPIKQSWVTNAYSIYQSGTADTNYLAGITRLPNLSQVDDTTTYKPAALDANGNLYKFDHWRGSGSVVDSSVFATVFSTRKEQFLDSIYNKESFSGITDFVDNSSGGVVTGDDIVFASGAGNFSKTLDLKVTNISSDHYTMLNHWKVTAGFIITSGSTCGGVGLNSYNTFAPHYTLAQINTSNNHLVIWVDGGVAYDQASAFTWSTNDSIEITYERKAHAFTASVRNVTTNSATTYVPINLGFGGLSLPNTGRFSIFNIGGGFKVYKFQVTSTETKNAELMCVGDSKTAGYNATYAEYSFPYLLGKNNSVVVQAGPADVTANVIQQLPEIIAMRPRQVLLCIGVNDISFGVSSGTWQANIATIVSTLEAADIRVTLINSLYDITSAPTLAAHINSTYPYSQVIDAYTAGNRNGTLAGDNVHPTDFGHQVAYEAIVSSKKLLFGNINNDRDSVFYTATVTKNLLMGISRLFPTLATDGDIIMPTQTKITSAFSTASIQNSIELIDNTACTNFRAYFNGGAGYSVFNFYAPIGGTGTQTSAFKIYNSGDADIYASLKLGQGLTPVGFGVGTGNVYLDGNGAVAAAHLNQNRRGSYTPFTTQGVSEFRNWFWDSISDPSRHLSHAFYVPNGVTGTQRIAFAIDQNARTYIYNSDSSGSPANMAWIDPVTKDVKLAAVPTASTTLDQAIANGNALTTNRTIANSTFQLDITGSRNFVDGYTFGVTNTTGTVGVAIKGIAADGRGIWGEVTTGVGVYGNATSGYGVFSSATTGNALYAQSTDGLAIEALINPSSTNTDIPITTKTRATSGTAANGIGQHDQYIISTSDGSAQEAGRFGILWSNATTASRTSRAYVALVNNAGTTTSVATFDGNGNATFGSTNAIVGTATNNDAVAGNIGEYITATIASGSAVALASTTTANVTSISLTPGDWDVTGVVDYAMTSATATNFSHGTSTTSATLGAQDTYVQNPFAFAGSSATFGATVPVTRVSIAGTTTVYLVTQVTFSGGSVAAYGTIRARRVR